MMPRRRWSLSCSCSSWKPIPSHAPRSMTSAVKCSGAEHLPLTRRPGPGPGGGAGDLTGPSRARGDGQEEVKILGKAAAAVEAVVPPKTATAWSLSSTVTGCGSDAAAMAGGVVLGILRLDRQGAGAVGDPACLADGPDRHDPPGRTGNLRCAACPCRARSRPLHHGRAHHHRRPADAQGRPGPPARPLPG
jgi:hypothetical protein